MLAHIGFFVGNVGLGGLGQERQAATGCPDFGLCQVHAQQLDVVILTAVFEPRTRDCGPKFVQFGRIGCSLNPAANARV